MRTFAALMLLLTAAPAAAAAQNHATPAPAPTFGAIGRTTSTVHLTFGAAGTNRLVPTANGNTCISSIDARTPIARGANPIGPVTGGPAQTNTIVAVPVGGGNVARNTNLARNAEACGPAR